MVSALVSQAEKRITVAICTYNRADRLPDLIGAIRGQECPIPFDILVVDNNSSDNTQTILSRLSRAEGPVLHFVREERQGIVYARNRAIEEAKGSAYLAFIDDDENPCPGWLNAAVDALDRENADCVGGQIRVNLPSEKRPKWMSDELFGFLGEVRYAATSFWITDNITPIWTGNIAYRLSLFADDLRFDERYNRIGNRVGGSEDAAMFKVLFERGVRMRYRPDMSIDHSVDDGKLKRSYFLKLHYAAGRRRGRWESACYDRTLAGVPPFMLLQLLQQCGRVCTEYLKHMPGVLRQTMNVAFALGMIVGCFQGRKSRRVVGDLL